MVRSHKIRDKEGKTDPKLKVAFFPAASDNLDDGISTYPERRKGHYACLDYHFCTLISLFNVTMGPGMGLHSSRPCPAMDNYLPCNGLLYAELQVIPLYGHEHESNHAATECIGGNFNETITSLSMLLHHCRTGINTACVYQLTTSGPSLSKRINGGGPLRLAR